MPSLKELPNCHARLVEHKAVLTNLVAVGKELHAVTALTCFAAEGPVERAVIYLTGILNILLERIGHLSVLKVKDLALLLTQQLVTGTCEAQIDGLHARLGGDILTDGIVELQFDSLTQIAGLLVAVVERRHLKVGDIQPLCPRDGLCQLLILGSQSGILLTYLLILLLDLLVLSLWP